MLSPSELQQFCANGKIKAIECETTTGIASYSTGEIAMCTIEGGSVCLNADNTPMPCSDYKIRYYCECNGMYLFKDRIVSYFLIQQAQQEYVTHIWKMIRYLLKNDSCTEDLLEKRTLIYGRSRSFWEQNMISTT